MQKKEEKKHSLLIIIVKIFLCKFLVLVLPVYSFSHFFFSTLVPSRDIMSCLVAVFGLSFILAPDLMLNKSNPSGLISTAWNRTGCPPVSHSACQSVHLQAPPLTCITQLLIYSHSFEPVLLLLQCLISANIFFLRVFVDIYDHLVAFKLKNCSNDLLLMSRISIGSLFLRL